MAAARTGTEEQTSQVDDFRTTPDFRMEGNEKLKTAI
jgi:hypothetical protein